MATAKTMIADIKGKLDELESELTQIETQARADSSTEAERHRLALEDVLADLQQRIDEYHELAGMDAGEGAQNWQQMDQDLRALDNDLYGAN